MKKRKNKKTYPGLSKRRNSATSHEYIDQDYLHKLSPKELEWLSNFQEEYLRGNFKHGGKRIHKGKTKELECYTRNNARNRCELSRAKAGNMMSDSDANNALETKRDPSNVEDTLITLLDLKKKLD